MEKISIIIPVYNAEKYLEQCLDSVMHQTYESFEAILVNDGSTDHSEELCQKYVDKDSRFILISGPNRGSAEARNIGLKRVSGEFIAFLDSDDWYENDYLEYLMTGLKTKGTDIYFCNYKTDEVREYDWEEDVVMSSDEALYQLLVRGCCNRIHNKLYKREVVGDIEFPVGRNMWEDAVWTCHVLERAGTIGRGKEAKYNVRLTEGSITRKRHRTETELCGYYRNFLERCMVLLDHYPTEKEKQKVVNKECIDRMTVVLDSGCDLSLWDVYDYARSIVVKHEAKLRNDAPRLCDYFLKYTDYKKCDRAYLRNVLLSKSEPFAHKKEVVRKHILSAWRKRFHR